MLDAALQTGKNSTEDGEIYSQMVNAAFKDTDKPSWPNPNQ